jgi:tetratricopeptide (TPR) repeat protein
MKPQDLEAFDVERHDPEDFPGKTVEIYGTSYVIGPIIGHGEEKIVCFLTNLMSGLARHVIRIYRDKEESYAREMRSVKLRESKLAREEMIYDYMNVPHPTARIMLQTLAYEHEPYAELMNEARLLIEREKDDQALAVLDRILAQSPFHTDAMIKKAELYGRQEYGLQTAAALALSAFQVEPNFLPYMKAIIPLLIRAGDSANAERIYEVQQQKYPYFLGLSVPMIRMHLQAGRSDRAAIIRKNLPLDAWLEAGHGSEQSEIEDIDKNIVTALSADFRASHLMLEASRTVSGVMKQGLSQRQANIFDQSFELVQRALDLCPTDKIIQANAGLLLAARGIYEEAYSVLENAAKGLQDDAAGACAVNAAYCAIRAGHFTQALDTYLEAMQIIRSFAGSRPAIENIPRLAYWIDATGIPTYFDAEETTAVLERFISSAPSEESKAIAIFSDLLATYKRWMQQQKDETAFILAQKNIDVTEKRT